MPTSSAIPLGSLHRGFPAAFKLRPAAHTAAAASGPVKKSLFAMQREAMTHAQAQSPSSPQPAFTAPTPAPPPPPHAAAPAVTQLRPASAEPEMETEDDEAAGAWRDRPVDLRREMARIRAENEQKVASMTAEEIREAQEELTAQLSPAVIAALRKRATASSTSSLSASASRSQSQQQAARLAMDPLFGQDEQTADNETAGISERRDEEKEEEKEELPLPPDASVSTPLPSPYHANAKTAWMEPLPYPSGPPPWPTLTWDTGIAAAVSSDSDSSAPPPPPLGTAWSYWRVDFKGGFLPASSSTSSDRYDGLYHHGDQPQLAGYSMQELLILSRSSLPSQRVTALSTLAAVLSCLHSRAYSPPPLSSLRADINDVVMEHLLALGLCSSLRVSLDDAVVGVVIAALRAIESLLCRREEEERREALASASDGHRYHVPTMSRQALAAREDPYALPIVNDSVLKAYCRRLEGGEEAEEEEDAEAVNDNAKDEAICLRDVVAGLVQMQLLPRLRYLLQLQSASSSPSSAIVNSILHILLTVAQHSPAAACAVHRTPHMLPLLASMVQPQPAASSSSSASLSQHLFPLLSVLAASSSTALLYLSSSSALLYSHHYLLVSNGLPGQLRPPVFAPSLSLSAASLRLWRVALGYGKDAESWLVFFPVLMQLMTGWVGRGSADGEEVETAEMQQVSAAYSVLEGLCWCAQQTDSEGEGEEDKQISVTHLVNSLDHCVSELSTLLFSPLPHSASDSPARLSAYLSCLAGMTHFVASYYTALAATPDFSSSFSMTQLHRQWNSVLSRLQDSPAVQHCVAVLSSSSPPAPSSSFFCFPSASLTSPALVHTDLLLALSRWLNVTLKLDADIASSQSVISSCSLLNGVLSTVAALPAVDLHSALLVHQILLIQLKTAAVTSALTSFPQQYRAAMIVTPVLLSCGYREEARQLLREMLLSTESLSAMRDLMQHGWIERRSGAVRECGLCGWRATDILPASAMRETLLPALETLMLRSQQGDGAKVEEEAVTAAAAAISSHSLSVQSLALPPSTSPFALHGHAADVTWLLQAFRSGMLLSTAASASAPSSRGLEQRLTLTRAFLQLVLLQINGLLFPTQVERTVTIRAVMEIFTLGPAVYTDPAVSPTLSHLSHVLLPAFTFSTPLLNSTRGWGWNFFSFFHSLLDRYSEEGLQDVAFSSFVLLMLQRSHPHDYRLLILSSLAHGDIAQEDGVIVAWDQCLWPREENAEVLRAYKDWLLRRGGAGADSGVMMTVAMHHLLCDWFGEEHVRAGKQATGMEATVRSRLGGGAHEPVVHALCSYRYSRRSDTSR